MTGRPYLHSSNVIWIWRSVVLLATGMSAIYIYAGLTRRGPAEPFRWSQLMFVKVPFRTASKRLLLLEGSFLLITTIVASAWHALVFR